MLSRVTDSCTETSSQVTVDPLGSLFIAFRSLVFHSSAPVTRSGARLGSMFSHLVTRVVALALFRWGIQSRSSLGAMSFKVSGDVDQSVCRKVAPRSAGRIPSSA